MFLPTATSVDYKFSTKGYLYDKIMVVGLFFMKGELFMYDVIIVGAGRAGIFTS